MRSHDLPLNFDEWPNLHELEAHTQPQPELDHDVHTSAEDLLESIERDRERFIGTKMIFALLLLVAFEWSMCDEVDRQAASAASVVEEP